MINYIIIISLLSCFIILVLDKTGEREFLQNRTSYLFSEMLKCDFCLSFWLALVISFVIFFITFDSKVLFIPFLSAPITRFLL